MDTYWLECKHGGLKNDQPNENVILKNFFEDVRPVYIRRLKEEEPI